MKKVQVFTAQPGGREPTPAIITIEEPLPDSDTLAEAAELMDEQALLIVNALCGAQPSGVLDRVTTLLLQNEVKERLLHIVWQRGGK